MRSQLSRSGLASQAGLTLVEILIVLVIIGLVGSWLATRVIGGKCRANALITESKIKQVGQYIEMFQLRNNALPQSLGELTCESSSTANCLPLANVEELKDGWGQEFNYSLEEGGRRYRIKSFGDDGKEGGTKCDSDLFGSGP